MNWIVNSRGGPSQSSWEISVIHKDFSHGFHSYGWQDHLPMHKREPTQEEKDRGVLAVHTPEGETYVPSQKVHISSSGGPCHNVVDQFTWDLLISVANSVAAKLNEESKS